MSALPLRFFFCMSIGGWPRPAAQHGHGPAAWGQRLPGHDLRPPQAQVTRACATACRNACVCAVCCVR
eukprot:scaffold47003_cov18-Tisochrysis_lutea.AAC.1